jgi:LysM domain/Peptidase M16 inactive domain
MRTPLFVAASALALLSTCTRVGRSERVRDSSGASPLASVERYVLGGTDILVVSGADTAVVAVCLAALEAEAGSAPDPLELARRGGTEHRERVPGGSLWCATLPTSELAFAIWLSAHLRPASITKEADAGDRATAPVDSRRRVRDLSFEGAVFTDPLAPRRVVAVAGSASGQDVARLTSRYFGAVVVAPRGRSPHASFHQTTERLTVFEGPEETPHVEYAWAAPESDADVAAAEDVAFEILAGSEEARLQRLLVPRGLARRLSRWSYHERGSTLLGVTVETTTRASVDRVRRFVDGAVKQLRLVGPSAREVSQASAHLRQRALETWENVEERAAALAACEWEQGDAGRFGDGLKGLTTVTPERVRRAAHERLVDARRTTIEIYPKLWPTDDPTLSQHRLYTVAVGDTLDAVARRFHVDAVRLARDNDVDPRYRLVPGQPLWIPP